MRQINFLAALCHFNETIRQQLKATSGGPCTFSNPSLSSAIVHVTPTKSLVGDQPMYEVSAECHERDVQQLITVVLPAMAVPSSTMSRSCSVACNLMARELEDGTYLHTGGVWTRFDQADELLATLEAATEVFEIAIKDPRRQHSTCNNVDLNSASDSPTATSSSSSSFAGGCGEGSSSSKSKSKSKSSSKCENGSEQIFRGVRARCDIPANIPIATYSGHCVTTLDQVQHDSSSSTVDAAYFQRFLLGPEQYAVAGREVGVSCYGNPFGRSLGPMVNDRSGTGKPINCGIGCLLRKQGKQVQLQDVLLTVNRIPAGEELLVAYKHDPRDEAAMAAAQGSQNSGL